MARTSAPEVPNMYSGPDAQVGMNHQPISQNRLKERKALTKTQVRQLLVHKQMQYSKHEGIN